MHTLKVCPLSFSKKKNENDLAGGQEEASFQNEG